ncbi:hypothetical protein B9Z55_016093 [Caenorhabditis nigoni]|nr:hypothetical protein B9Z55_016093 [Caenorhabditis nigoni]
MTNVWVLIVTFVLPIQTVVFPGYPTTFDLQRIREDLQRLSASARSLTPFGSFPIAKQKWDWISKGVPKGNKTRIRFSIFGTVSIRGVQNDLERKNMRGIWMWMESED